MFAATLAFGSVNMCYSLLAVKAKNTFRTPHISNIINTTAGAMMVSAGCIVAAKA